MSNKRKIENRTHLKLRFYLLYILQYLDIEKLHCIEINELNFAESKIKEVYTIVTISTKTQRIK